MSGDLDGQLLELPEVRISFGRAPDNVIVTNNPAVSSHHAALMPESGGFVLYDLNSTNGTFVNGQQIQQKRLFNGDRIRIGILELRYELEGAAQIPESPAPPTAPSEPEIKPEAEQGKVVEPPSAPAPPPPPPHKPQMRVTMHPKEEKPATAPAEVRPSPVAETPAHEKIPARAQPPVPAPPISPKPPVPVAVPPKTEPEIIPTSPPPPPVVVTPVPVVEKKPITEKPPVQPAPVVETPAPERIPAVTRPPAPIPPKPPRPIAVPPPPQPPVPVVVPRVTEPSPIVEAVQPARVAPPVPVKVVVTEIVRDRPRDLRAEFEILPPIDTTVFVQDARQVVALRETSAPFVPLKTFWPAYDAMDAAQQRWYFYWRDVLRHEQYPNTDTAYIFLHAYELINQVGVRNAADGFRQLHTLWLRYRGRHPRLDAYFVDWLADYVMVNPCGVDPLNIYFEAFELGGFADKPDLLLSKVLAAKDAPLPRRLLLALADYPLRYSKFYLDGNQRLLDEFVLKAFQVVDARLIETEGLGIFDKFAPAATETVCRMPFQGALYAGDAREITIGTLLPYSKSGKLRDFASAVIKHTENCFRELAGYSGRLQNYELSPDLRSAITAFIRNNAASLVKPPKTGVFSRVENRFSNHDALRSVLVRCSADEKEAIQSAAGQGGVAIPAEIIEYVNQLACRFLGDALLFCKQAAWHVVDDYLEDLNSLLSQPAKIDPGLWQKFLSQLSDTQRRILAAIASQKIFSDEIRQLSGSRSALETVFHSINDLSRKTLGEDVIETWAIPAKINRDDAELIERLLTKR